jgi:hypothetical protein
LAGDDLIPPRRALRAICVDDARIDELPVPTARSEPFGENTPGR